MDISAAARLVSVAAAFVLAFKLCKRGDGTPNPVQHSKARSTVVEPQIVSIQNLQPQINSFWRSAVVYSVLVSCCVWLCVYHGWWSAIPLLLPWGCDRLLAYTSTSPAAVTSANLQTTDDRRLDLSGVWLKDHEASDSMNEAADAMQLNGIVRTAINLVRGMNLKQSSEKLELAIFSVLPGFKITERYTFDGLPSKWNRRDLRPGKHDGTLSWAEAGQAITLTMVWAEPLGGRGVERMTLPDPNTLLIETHLWVRQREVTYSSVYRRKGT